MDAAPFSPTVVKAAFRDVTWMHVSRPAVRAAASVTRTLLTEIIEGARAAAAEEGITKLRPRHLVTAIDRNVEVDVAHEWYAYSPTFRALDGGVQSAAMPSRRRHHQATSPDRGTPGSPHLRIGLSERPATGHRPPVSLRPLSPAAPGRSR